MTKPSASSVSSHEIVHGDRGPYCDWILVYFGRLVLPMANRASSGDIENQRATQKFEVFNLPLFVDKSRKLDNSLNTTPFCRGRVLWLNFFYQPGRSYVPTGRRTGKPNLVFVTGYVADE